MRFPSFHGRRRVFKITYKDLRTDTFRQAVGKLAMCPEYKDVKVAYRIGRLVQDVEKALKKSQREWLELADPLLEKDDKGNFKLDPKEGFTFKDGVDKAKAEESIEVFTEKEAVLDHPRIKLADVAPAKLNPFELVALADVLQDG